MIAPKPFKHKCSECGHTKIVKPKSDVLNPTDWIKICPKCKAEMTKQELNIFERFLYTRK
ncbi:MAG: hypothetical protein U9R16_02960 [Campylobacterota bacterium]|nr:hypothetical protein [Campylobacterota bacterium]